MSSTDRPLLEVERVGLSLERQEVLHDLDLTLGPGEFLTLLGPNGSGKTTLLRAIVGLAPLGSGRVRLDGVDLAGVPVHRRRIGLLFQEPVLFEGRTVFANVAYGPLVQGRPPSEARAEADRALGLVGLRDLALRSAARLSGGERQRVALARAIAARPRLLLLDEPFASIDPDRRAELRGEFRSVLRTLGIAALHVTHDREEALFLGDRVALLFAGRLRGVGTPEEIYRRPADREVARFLGYNVLPTGDGWRAVAPRDLRLEPSGAAGIPAEVIATGFVGGEVSVLARTSDGERLELRGPVTGRRWSPGDRGVLAWERDAPIGEAP